MATIITGTGSIIPKYIKSNQDFISNTFYDEQSELIKTPNQEIVEKFKGITGIIERRYADVQINTSDLAAAAAKLAIEDAGIDPETIDQIIVAHNFGDVKNGTIQSDAIPAIASRVKHHLGIVNPSCVAYDILLAALGGYKGSFKQILLLNLVWQKDV